MSCAWTSALAPKTLLTYPREDREAIFRAAGWFVSPREIAAEHEHELAVCDKADREHRREIPREM